MVHRNRTAKINVKVLVILVVIVAALGVSLVVARQVRRSILSKMDLEAGTAAFEKEDWQVAASHLQEYLGRNPEDVEILKKYAQARLAIRPVELASIGGAISAYRRVIRLSPLDEVAYEKLAMLYTSTGNFSDLAYIARRRIELTPDGKKAPLWLAEALIQLNKSQEAQQTLEEFIGTLEGLASTHTEYVRACELMSQIVAADDAEAAKTEALGWLSKAVDYAPESVEAVAARAHFYRTTPQIPGISEQDRLTLARRDLEAADAIGTDNPKSLYFLGVEWASFGEFDRAATELKVAEELPEETLSDYSFDLSDWTVAKFSLASQLTMVRGDTTEGVSLADDVLTTLTEKRHRIRVLPSVIQIYVTAGEVAKARRCLDEYVDAQYVQEGKGDSKLRLAYLRALVARAEDNAYGVIDVLQPVVVSNSSRADLWRLLAEAFSRTDQPRRAVDALIRYLRLRPRDPEMTLQLAKEYLKLRDWNRAFETARLAEPLDPTDIVLRLLRIEASIYIAAEQQQQIDMARLEALWDELTDLRRDHPSRVDIRILQAMIAVYMGQSELAERELKSAIEECEEPLRAEMQLVRHYYRTKRMADAISLCQAACEHHPGVAEPWLSLSGLYSAEADNDAARRCLRQGLEAVAGKWEDRSISLRLALLELMDGDRTVGIDLLTELVERDEREVHARTLLLGTREIQSDLARAQRLIDELHAAEGESGLRWRLHQASLWLGSDDWRSRQQDITGALQYCIDSDPEWSSPVLLLVQMYEMLNDSDRVEDVCRRGLVRNPSATDIADRLMSLLEKQGRYADAEQILQQIEADAHVASAWQIQIALRAGDFSRAIDELKLRVSNDNRDAESRILLARLIYWQTRDSDQAFAYLTEAEAIASGSLALAAAKASILRAEGQGTEAQRVLNEYVVNRGDFSAYMLRAAYLVNEGRLEEAENDYRRLTTFPENSVAGYMLLGNFYATNSKLDSAVAAVEEGLEKHPEDPRLERALMKILLRRAQGQDQQRALEILGALERRMPRDPELMKLRAMQLLQDPTPETLALAREKLKDVVRLEPTAVDAHLTLIGIAIQEGAYDDARDVALRALGANPDDSALLAARGRAELRLGNTQMAIQLARLSLQNDPNSAVARDVVVTAAQNTRDRVLLNEALGWIEAALTRDPANVQLLLARAQVLVSLQQPQKALPELEAYCRTEAGSRDVTALVTVADLYRLAGDADTAKERIDRMQEQYPDSQAVVHARLLWLVDQKEYEALAAITSAYLSVEEQNPAMLLNAGFVLSSCDSIEARKEAVRLFEHAVTLSPTSIDARLGLASSLCQTEDTQGAERLCQELWDQTNDDATTCLNVASRLYQTGYAAGAEKIYRQLLQRNQNDTRILNDLAWILQEHDQRYDEALALANRGLKAKADDLHLLDTRGTILSNMPGRLAEAKGDFQRVLALSSGDTRRQAKTLLQLGRICIKLGSLAEAKQQLEKAQEIDRRISVFTAEERSEIATIVQGGTG